MSFHIIIKGKDKQHKLGKTRSEQEKNIRKEWGSTMSDHQLHKLEKFEKTIKNRTGQIKGFIPGHVIDKIQD